MTEHQDTITEIKRLKEVEIPKWTKKRKELEEIIKKAKAAHEEKTEGN